MEENWRRVSKIHIKEAQDQDIHHNDSSISDDRFGLK